MQLSVREWNKRYLFIQCTQNDWVYKIQRKGNPELLVTFLKKKYLALILPVRAVPGHTSGPGGRGILPMMAIRGGSDRKGYLFQASGI